MSLWAICMAGSPFALAAPHPDTASAGPTGPAATGPVILVAQAPAAEPGVGGAPAQPPANAQVSPGAVPAVGSDGYSYNPSGRRDPFAPIILESQVHAAAENLNLPPLQRVSFTELNLIGIMWGSFGYTAMVQTPDGKGYAVRRGTRIGPNDGVVSDITENSIVLQERFTDVYGKKQVREYVKLLHPKEASE